MSRSSIHASIAVALALAVGGCGSSDPSAQGGGVQATAGAGSAPATPLAGVPHSHPQAIEPTAGTQAPVTPADQGAIVGDVNAHAPSLASVKRELQRLNLCGGVTNRAEATPIVRSTAPGFVADPGTSQTEGQLPQLTAALNALGKALGVTIYGISGYRTPAHSVAVGGYANDPHTRGQAEDIGVGSLLRSSAAQISEAELARYGLYRPFDPSGNPFNTEVNHIQLIPNGGPLSLVQATSTFDPDPSCR